MAALQRIIRDTTGTPLSGASVVVTRAADGSVPTLYTLGTTGPGAALGSNTLTTDANGYIKCWAPDGLYKLQVYVAAVLVATFDAVQVGGYAPVTNAIKVLNVEDWPYNARPTDSDSKAAIRAAVADLVAAGEKAVLLLPRKYNISGGLSLPDFISVVGLSKSDSGLKRIAGEYGPLLELTPYTGRSGGVRMQQDIKHLALDGNVIGLTKATATVTSGSDTITNVSDTTPFVAGYVVEGIGIPTGTTVVSVTVPGVGGSVKLSAVATSSNGTRTKVVVREAYTKTCGATLNSAVLTTANTTGVQPGMRAFGTVLPADDPDALPADLNAWCRVRSVQAGVSITLDRVMTATGTGSVTFFAANDNVLITEVTQAPSYDSAKEYGHVMIEDCEITQAGYHNVCARPGRDQLHMKHVKITAGYGYGLHVSGCNDCYFERTSSGSNWYSAIVFAGMATPRWTGEAWQSYLSDQYYDVRMQGIREVQLGKADINGRLYVKGKTDEAMELVTVEGINFKWTAANNVPGGPGGTAQSYIHANSATVVVIGGGFKPDRTDGSRPQYLGETSNGGRIVVRDQHWPDNTADATCPYAVGIAPAGSDVNVDFVDDVTGRSVRTMAAAFVTVASGDTVTLARTADHTTLTRASAGGIATLTVNLPANPKDNELAAWSIMPAVTTLTLATTDGSTIERPPTTSAEAQAFRYRYRASNAKWYAAGL